jgi:hypothetical protein
MNAAFPEFSPRYLDWVRRGRDVSGGIYDTMLHSPTSDKRSESDALNEYLTNYLRAEVAFLQFENNTPQDVDAAFVLDLAATDGAQLTPATRWSNLALNRLQAKQITVTDSHIFQGVLWAECHIQDIEEEQIVLVPFLINGMHWFRVDQVPADWGEIVLEDGSYVTLEYLESEHVFLEGLAPELDAIYQQTAHDSGIEKPMKLKVSFRRDKIAPSRRFAFDEGNLSLEVYMQTPYLDAYTALPNKSLREAIREAIIYQMTEALEYQRANPYLGYIVQE